MCGDIRYYAKEKRERMKSIGFIDYYLDEFHANNYPEWIKNLSNGELEVKYAYAVKDSPLKGGKTTDEWCREKKIQRISSIEELSEISDCINVLSPDNPEKHAELCKIPLKTGKRVYVDKTFSNSGAEAREIFSWAEESGTPCFSASALRFAPEYQKFRNNVKGIVSYGPGAVDNYSIHQIEPIIYLMGSNVKRVKFTGTEDKPSYIIEFTDGRRAIATHHGWDCHFGMVIDGRDGKTYQTNVESDYFGEFVKSMIKFYITGEVEVPHSDTIAVISVREALLKSLQSPDTWTDIK
jgi:predicted dehydrogenase